MALSFTEGAAEAVRRMIDERGGGLGIRLIVEPSECSGLAYRLQFVDELAEDDSSIRADYESYEPQADYLDRRERKEGLGVHRRADGDELAWQEVKEGPGGRIQDKGRGIGGFFDALDAGKRRIALPVKVVVCDGVHDV